MDPRVYAHLVGVGGAGMSAIARVLNDRGIRVTGSDLKDSRYARALREQGVPVAVGHAAENLGDPEVVVVSSAIPEANPELIEARRRNIPIWPRAKMLASLAGGLSTIAVAGTHGKTTTSAMVATMLDGMGLSPTYLVGGEVSGKGTNAGCGTGDYYVVEADESDGSFMFLDPQVAIVTNIEADHLDHYGSLARVEETFVEFMQKVPANGVLVVCADDERLLELASGCEARVVTYGRAAGADVRCIASEAGGMTQGFEVRFPADVRTQVSIRVPGEHMVQNATAALAVAWALGFDVAAAAQALLGYTGVKRRFDHVDSVSGVDVVDDYAHHPTEVRATLSAARTCGYERVWVLFQPHRYSRTKSFAEEFGSAFDDADGIVLMDVYSAGETPVPGITGKTILDSLLLHAPRSRVAYLPHRADIATYLGERLRRGDIVLTMGAGDVTTVGPEIVSVLESHAGKDLGCR